MTLKSQKLVKTYCLKCCLKQIIRDEVTSEVKKVVHDVPLLVLEVGAGGHGHVCLGVRVAGVEDDHEAQANHGGGQGGQDEEHDGPQGNHTVHLNMSVSMGENYSSNTTLALRLAEPVMRLAMTRGRIISLRSLMKSSPG